MKMNRYSALAAAVAAALASLPAAAEIGVSIEAAKPGPVISKYVYGQFAEHLGTGIYGGLWVGPDSAIPNTRGWRNDVVAALKELHVPVVRWPGGCFADQYHWRDGIGPRAGRPVRINTNWGGVDEDNAVGTHEFFELVEQLGADAYVNGNLGSGTVQEMAEWVEYLTAGGKSSLAALRARNGHPAPYKVAFLGIGNEAWGCGGNMQVEQYAREYQRYASFVHPASGNTQFIAAGGHDDDTSWTDHLSSKVQGRLDGISFHYYTSPGADSKGKYGATGFDESRWIATLRQTQRMEGFIADNVARMDQHDKQNKLAFVVDEWGTWYDAEEGSTPGFLVQQNSLRDALVAALNFNIFHAHADRVRMTSIAQMVNVLQAMIRTDGGRMVLTPTYHAFRMYVPFQDATSVPVRLASNPQYSHGGVGIPAVSASAARGRDGRLHLALVNTNPGAVAEVAVDIDGARAVSASGTVLTAGAMDAHNTFDAPETVKPAPFSATARGGRLVMTLPAKSIVVVAVQAAAD
ncbi:alpha-N-arabinofuranosidase [Duganella sp. BJB488]|uniref:alpha-N-arabinofuranosidase n=1 Tax=unclassified Duganella TaxID=2636909 RepID=UPI000E353D0A|nr:MULTISPECIES: alpha-L-arabinofuranosidase C-terminal domain-containing protein [unclassified Duganella]RFP17842.1 alpha-N-arabinofuranosidase [Duganella sp. BJB489]RFP22349.1 alpha-N-arabinofuranosidase [Duganella sp. BJB488]RFP37682.1 alpha-N-arabinofuranosidase [Duganella sp. BJB480]